MGVAARVLPEEIRSSINPTGEITFDIKTFRKMGEPQAIVMLYEESTRTIGLKPAHPDAANAVLVRVRHARSNRVVRSAPFLRENGIVIETSLRIPYPALEDNVLILDLRTAVKCGKGGWKKAKARLARPRLTDDERAQRSAEREHLRKIRQAEAAKKRERSLAIARARAYVKQKYGEVDQSPADTPKRTFGSGGF
jgi:hypothetical protein